MVQGGRSQHASQFTMFEGAKLLNHQSSNGIVKVLSHTIVLWEQMSNCEELSSFTKLAWIGAQSVYGKFLTTATETRNIGIGLSMSFPFEECPVWPTPFLFECKHYQSLDRVPHASWVVRGTFYQLTIWLDWTILNHCLVARRQSFARIDCYHLNDTCVFYQCSKLSTDWQTTFG